MLPERVALGIVAGKDHLPDPAPLADQLHPVPVYPLQNWKGGHLGVQADLERPIPKDHAAVQGLGDQGAEVIFPGDLRPQIPLLRLRKVQLIQVGHNQAGQGLDDLPGQAGMAFAQLQPPGRDRRPKALGGPVRRLPVK